MRVEYNITDEQLLAAFAAAVPGPDDGVYVWLPRLILDKQPSPTRFPAGTTLEEVWRLIVKNVITRIRGVPIVRLTPRIRGFIGWNSCVVKRHPFGLASFLAASHKSERIALACTGL